MSLVQRFSRLAFCSALLFVSASHLRAQVTATAPPLSVALADYNNRWDAFGGYSYSRFNTTIGHGLKTNLNGWKLQATAWLNPIVGLTAATASYYGSVPLATNEFALNSASVSEHMFLFGPEVRVLRHPKLAVDVHLLLGGTYGIFDNSFKSLNVEPNIFNLPNNQLAFAMAAGASYDYNLNSQFAIRGTTDFQPTHYGLAFQKEFSASAGVVYKWGTIHK